MPFTKEEIQENVAYMGTKLRLEGKDLSDVNTVVTWFFENYDDFQDRQAMSDFVKPIRKQELLQAKAKLEPRLQEINDELDQLNAVTP